jgi:transglutaminase-like putative cysteine protease
VIARTAWSAVVLVVGAVQLAAGWAGWLAAAVFAGAVVVTYAVTLGARAVCVPAGITVLAVMTVAVAGAYLVAPAPGPLDAVLDSVPRLLTAPRPAPATPALLVPGVLLVVVVSLVSALTLGARALVVPAAGGAVLYVAAALLTAGRADPHGLGAAVLLVVIAVGWVVIDRPAALSGVLVAGLAAVAGVATVLPADVPFEPRTLVTPPVTDLPVSSPLPRLAAWAASGDTELFRVRGAQAATRLVALADYTGATWQASSLYGPLGTVAPPLLPDGVRRVETSVEVTVGDLAVPWLPTTGRPVSTTAADAVVDPDSGSMVLPAGVRKGFSYTVTSTVDSPGDGDLIAATVPDAVTARRYLALPGLPYSLAEYARRTVAEARTPFEKAVAIEEVVRAGRVPDADAPVGSSYARLETFLFGAAGTAGAGAGTAEQFASAFAVLARAVGLPTRVVVGFQPVPPSSDGVSVVRARDATAWPEVYFAGWGWVPFDPVSGTGSGAGAASRREVINRLATPTPAPVSEEPDAPPVPEVPDVVAAPSSGGGRWVLLAGVPVVVLGVLGALRAGRRFRLRRAGAVGAWGYVLDSLLLAGRSPARHRPAPEIAADVGIPGAAGVAALADRAAFGPSPVPSRGAWPLARQVRAGLRRRVPWYRRMFWAVDPRPLWRR